MSLLSVWLHVLGMAVWIGGVAHQSHVILPEARRTGDARLFADVARRGRPVVWIAVCFVVLTGLYNVTRLGPLERVMGSGAATLLAAKLILVLAMISLTAQRDFGQVPRLAGAGTASALTAIAWLDRVVLLLAVVVIYLGLAVSRLAHQGGALDAALDQLRPRAACCISSARSSPARASLSSGLRRSASR